MTTQPDVQITVTRPTSDNDLSRVIAERVRVQLALNPKLRQIHIARAIGMPQQSFHNRVSGSVPFEAATLVKVAAVIGCPLSDLLPSEDLVSQQVSPVTRQEHTPHTAPVVSIWTAPSRRLSPAVFIPSQQTG